MKIFSSYTLRPGCVAEAAKRFLEGKATPPAGLKLIGRWHKTDGTGGYSVFEADSLATVYEFSLTWTDVLEIHDHLVIEDAEMGPALARVFGKWPARLRNPCGRAIRNVSAGELSREPIAVV